MHQPQYTLGTVEASEQLLRDLYLDLRKKIARWAAITHQTAQARMGYIGQHLVSVATGLPGGRSGARGDDLVHGDGAFSEIKTCYRVDQLGNCRQCGARVAAIEEVCPNPDCGSRDINRMDDSKWLIGIRNDAEFEKVISPRYYFLVLFDFVDLADPRVIRASIWQVDPRAPGFALCMIDYYKNIRARSASKAPFNLWPYQLKFGLMRPILIYRSLLRSDDSIETQLFPGRDQPLPERLKLLSYARSSSLTIDAVRVAAAGLGVEGSLGGGTKATLATLLERLEGVIDRRGIDRARVADSLARAMYLPNVEPYRATLPAGLREAMDLPHGVSDGG